MKEVIFSEIFLIFFLLLTPVSIATVSLGVQPSVINVTLSPNYPTIVIPLRLWNEGDEDAVFKLVPDDKLLEFVDFNETEVSVPAHTDRIYNYVEKPITLHKTEGNKSVETGIYISSTPTGSGMVKIIPRVFMKIYIFQSDTATEGKPYTFPTTTTTQPEQIQTYNNSSSTTQPFFLQPPLLWLIIAVVLIGLVLIGRYLYTTKPF